MILIGSLSAVLFVGAIVSDGTRAPRSKVMEGSRAVIEVRERRFAQRAESRGSGLLVCVLEE